MFELFEYIIYNSSQFNFQLRTWQSNYPNARLVAHLRPHHCWIFPNLSVFFRVCYVGISDRYVCEGKNMKKQDF